MTDRQDMEAVVEAILFVSNDPVSRSKLLEVFDEKERELAGEALDAVIERYRESRIRGVLIDEVAGGLRLVSRPDLHSYLRRFFEVTGNNKLSMPALESLAIIAYRQPVTAPEIQELRGVNSSGVLKKLLERRLIRIAGRKEVVGKPFLYGTTREFLQHFGLRNLKELPPLEQFEELFGGDAAGPPPESMPPDAEEEIQKEIAAVEETLDDALTQAEIESIEDERAAAEATADEIVAETDVVDDASAEGPSAEEAVVDDTAEQLGAEESVAEASDDAEADDATEEPEPEAIDSADSDAGDSVVEEPPIENSTLLVEVEA